MNIPFQSMSLISRRTVSSIAPSSKTARSAVFRGTQFEERSVSILQRLSMSLKRVGGAGDGGVDLVGWWWLPGTGQRHDDTTVPHRRIRVLAQCKAETKNLGPRYIREMEGVLHRYLISSHSAPMLQEPQVISSPDQLPMVALFISQSPFTKAALARAYSSPIPFVLIHIPPLDDVVGSTADQQLGSLVCNPALLGARGLLQGEMEVRLERSLCGNDSPGLWWRGSRLTSLIPKTTGMILDNRTPERTNNCR